MTRGFVFCLIGAVYCWGSDARLAQDHSRKAIVDSFELVWSTLRDQYWDRTMAGLNWQQVHDSYLPKVRSAATVIEARQIMTEMIHKLPSSHLALIPGEAYGESSEPDVASSPRKSHGGEGLTGLTITPIEKKMVVEFSDRADVHPGWIVESVDGDSVEKLGRLTADAGVAVIPQEIQAQIVQAWLSGPVGTSAHVVFARGDGSQSTLDIPRRMPPGKLVEFSNLPPEHVVVEHRRLPSGVGYIRLNIFLDPVSVMPEFEQAITDLRSGPGIVLDLRGNPGGLGIMAMGLAGWFVSEEGERLGTMVGRVQKTEFEINPRIEPYTGKLAILVDGGSASTTEILAQGLKDLGRARIFGTRTEGAALLSDFIELPDGDRFQYPEANYTSFKGRVLEGNGVEPDVVVAPTIAALLAGHDPALESAVTWSSAK
jgi:carboxyl-terminal processing protease